MLRTCVALAVLCLSLSACKDKTNDKSTEAKTADKQTAPAAVTFASVDDYLKRGAEEVDKIVAIFAAAGTDCDKLAGSLTKYMDDNKGMKEATDAFEKANPDAKKQFEEKMKPQIEKFMAAAGPAMEACKDHAGVKSAMDRMGD